MNKVSWRDRLRYAFDNTLSRGPIALIGWLALASIALVLLSAVLIWAGRMAPGADLVDLVWMNLMQTLDPGGVERDAGTWPFLITMLLVTLGGIFVTSTFIGVLTAGLEERIEALRKGRSIVVEDGHTVILGWSEQVFSILSELAIAKENEHKPCIVVMGNRDKIEMEDDIREKVGSTGHTRVVCRTGDPIDLSDLEIVSLDTARSIIVLSPDGEEPDSQVIKTILAITNHPNRRRARYHIVAAIRDPRNIEVAHLVGGDEVELIPVGDLISRLIAQTCRQSGLSVVYTDLFDFAGDEIYFQAEPRLEGRTFGQALLAYEDSAVIGICPRGGRPQLNPPMETPIGPGDQVIAISEDDDTVILSGLAQDRLQIVAGVIQAGQPVPPAAERTLILGWNWRAPMIINELDHYVAPGSEITVVANCPEGEEKIAQCCAGQRNQTVTFQLADTTSRGKLDELAVETYDHIIVLCYSDHLEPQQADARTLVTLLHLRDIAERIGRSFSIVSEMLDIRNRNLAEIAEADDFIVSDLLVSLMLAQISENKALNAVFADILDPEGAEIYLKPAVDYVQLGQPLNFYTVVEAARQRGEVALGYRLQAQAVDAAKNYGVVINPEKSALITFSEQDRVIVLAEES